MRVLAAIAAALLIAGCGGEAASSTEAEAPAAPATTERQPASAADALQISCPAGVADCETASGEIIYVERVDADGDGDAHFVLLSTESITAPGISVIDVRTDLRPHPLPGPGDLFAGAGPVYEGSYGQSQIQAEVVAFKRLP